jgi:hypothetical protein
VQKAQDQQWRGRFHGRIVEHWTLTFEFSGLGSTLRGHGADSSTNRIYDRARGETGIEEEFAWETLTTLRQPSAPKG